MYPCALLVYLPYYTLSSVVGLLVHWWPLFSTSWLNFIQLVLEFGPIVFSSCYMHVFVRFGLYVLTSMAMMVWWYYDIMNLKVMKQLYCNKLCCSIESVQTTRTVCWLTLSGYSRKMYQCIQSYKGSRMPVHGWASKQGSTWACNWSPAAVACKHCTCGSNPRLSSTLQLTLYSAFCESSITEARDMKTATEQRLRLRLANQAYN